MRTIRCPASTWRASTRPAVNLAHRRRSALLVTLNLAAAAIYLVHLGRGIGLGGYRIDLDVYRTGARVLLHGGDLYGRAAQARRRPPAAVHLPAVRSPFLHPADAPRLQHGELAAHCRHHRRRRGQSVVLRCQHRRRGGRPDAAAAALGAAGRAAPRTRPLHFGLRPDQRAADGPGRLRLPDPGAPMAARDRCRHRRRAETHSRGLRAVLPPSPRPAQRGPSRAEPCRLHRCRVRPSPARLAALLDPDGLPAHAGRRNLLRLEPVPPRNPGPPGPQQSRADLALARPVPARRGSRCHWHARRHPGRPRYARPGAQRRSRIADLAHILVTPLGLGGPRAARLPGRHELEPSTAADVRGPGTARFRDSPALAAPRRGRPRTALVMVAAGPRRLLRPDRPRRPHPSSDHQRATTPETPGSGHGGHAGSTARPELGPVPSQTHDDASVPAIADDEERRPAGHRQSPVRTVEPES